MRVKSLLFILLLSIATTAVQQGETETLNRMRSILQAPDKATRAQCVSVAKFVERPAWALKATNQDVTETDFFLNECVTRFALEPISDREWLLSAHGTAADQTRERLQAALKVLPADAQQQFYRAYNKR